MKHKFRVGDKIILEDTYGYPLTAGGIYRITKIDGSAHFIGSFPLNPQCFTLHKPAPRNTAVIRRTRNNGFRTTLVGKNGEVMFVSEVYTTKAKAIKTVRQVVPDFEIVDKTKNK